ncbi:tRNA wybutosine-synthesizing protein 5 isoform X4 [Nelusetta ayraudi]|uniref:tRNA wybutosine-synthesizing protein 5 isoform X4 n=1 Tax=Nelusetta ayraudi TaxID=303726 RepID=UPI003F723360
MELQEKENVSIFTDVEKEIFLRDIYPKTCGSERCGAGAVPGEVDGGIPRAKGRKQGSQDPCVHDAADGLPAQKLCVQEPADLTKQFPDLAEDFHIPQFFAADEFFSSVFRISSCGLQLWTHYDVMDNLLAQVTGRKRVVLYSPQDALHLYLSGDKSEVLDIDSPDLERFPEFVKARRFECVLEPGDLLFIPALWFRNTLALQFGIGVNVFWRHLPADGYDKRDPYGNKDPVAATRALQALERALHTLDQLPAEYRDFYGRRMIQRIQERTLCDGLSSREESENLLASRQLTKPG